MQTPTHHPTDDAMRHARANVLRVSVSQLGAWAADDMPHSVIVPMADEEAWEGTEIDVRRTVL